MFSIILFLFGCNSNNVKNYKVSDDDYNQATIAFSELDNVLINDNGKFWNHKLDGPILMVNMETNLFISNEQNEKNEFSIQGDLFIGKLPDNINIANTSIKWNNISWTMVSFPLPKSKIERLDLLIHESFHRIQPLIGFDSINEIQSAHLDTKEGRIYLKLEMEALKEALKSKNFEKHIKNALLFRQYRYQLFNNAKIAENSLEINEGIAEYTGKTLSGRNDNELKKYYISIIDLFYQAPTFVRSFAYYTIPIYGYFMKQSNNKWNLKINSKTNLTDFILDYFKVNLSILTKNEIMQIGKSYKIDSIIDYEENRELKRIEQKNIYKKTFLADSIFKINLEKPSVGFDPNNLFPLDSFGTVYPNLRITDEWGILDVDSCGALLSLDFKQVTITCPEIISDTLISGKGWKLKLEKKWKLEKNKIKYKLTKK
jgi:hypothetical protein